MGQQHNTTEMFSQGQGKPSQVMSKGHPGLGEGLVTEEAACAGEIMIFKIIGDGVLCLAVLQCRANT